MKRRPTPCGSYRLLDLVEQGQAPQAVLERIRDNEAQVEDLRSKEATLLATLDTVSQNGHTWENTRDAVEEFNSVIQGEDQERIGQVRVRLNAALKKLVHRVEVTRVAGTRLKHKPKYEGLTQDSKAGPVWNGNVRFWEPALQDVTIKRPTIWFVNSMGDLFHEQICLNDVHRVFEVMRDNPQHQFQVLTKRAERLAEVAAEIDWPENVWMGVSVEDERIIDRIDRLRRVPAHIRFLSLEPLIGPLPNLNLEGIHWVIVGGESGKDHRPMEGDWVRDIRDQCQAGGVRFFFKQWGGKTPKSNGKELDGREWQEFPIDLSPFEKAGKQYPKQLQKLAAKAIDLIKKAESGRVDAYVKAGKELIVAKAAVRNPPANSPQSIKAGNGVSQVPWLRKTSESSNA